MQDALHFLRLLQLAVSPVRLFDSSGHFISSYSYLVQHIFSYWDRLLTKPSFLLDTFHAMPRDLLKLEIFALLETEKDPTLRLVGIASCLR